MWHYTNKLFQGDDFISSTPSESTQESLKMWVIYTVLLSTTYVPLSVFCEVYAKGYISLINPICVKKFFLKNAMTDMLS